MVISSSVLFLYAVLILEIILCVFHYSIWRLQKDNNTPLWLAGFLGMGSVFASARLLQYASFNNPIIYVVLPRIVLGSSYILAWLGYKFSHSFLNVRPSQKERSIILLLVGSLLLLLVASNLILTRQAVIRSFMWGGSFRGVAVGPFYLPANILILLLGAIPISRLLRARDRNKNGTHLLAVGYIFIILFSLNDFLATSFNKHWVRLSDFSYLPVAVAFSYIQLQQLGRLYRNMGDLVQERTAKLSQLSISLQTEILERFHFEEKIKRNAAEMTALFETTHDLAIERELPRLLQTIIERAIKLIGASTGGLYLWDEELKELQLVVNFNGLPGLIKDRLRYGEGAAGQVVASGKALLIDDYRAWQGRLVNADQAFGIVSLLSVPMRWQERMIGVIQIVNNDRPSAFDQEDLRIISLFADQAAIAIENSRLFESEQERRRESAVIAEVSRDISASLQLKVVLEKIASHAQELLHAETSAVYLYDPVESNLLAIAACGPDANEIKQFPIKIGDGILGHIAMQNMGEIVNDTLSDPRTITIAGTKPDNADHIMSVPVISKNQLTGLIAVWRRLEDPIFKSTDLDFLSSLASQVGVAIENARLFENTKNRLAELEIIQSIASALRIAQSLGEALPIILDLLIRLLPASGAVFELLDADRREFVTELGYGLWADVTGLHTPANVGVSHRVITSGVPYISTNIIEDDVVARPDLIGQISSVICVPISAQKQPIGALWVGRQNRAPYTQEEVNLLAALGEMVGNTIHRMKLHEQTEHQNEEIIAAYEMTLEGWAKALELRDKETEGHSRRVTEITLRLAQKFGFSDAQLMNLRHGVLLHDIGKLGVEDQVLKKKGPLSDEEWIEMKKHPQYAYDLIHPIPYLRSALEIPYNHHERWDGSGYPRGLAGEQIPLAARIFAVVDVYDALSSDRPYRCAWPREKVIQYLQDQSGKQFDPVIVAAFLELLVEQYQPVSS